VNLQPADILRLDFATISDLIRAHARARPDCAALIQDGRAIDYSTLDQLTDRVAAALQRDGVRPGENVAICAATSIEYAAIFLGSLRAGAAVAPLPLSFGVRSIQAMVIDAGARKLFFDGAAAGAVMSWDGGPAAPLTVAIDDPGLDGFERWLDESKSAPQSVDVKPHWPFNVIYSSGTTDVPKGIVQPHSFRWSNIQRAVSFDYGPESVTLLATPLYSNMTLATLFGALALGGTIVLMHRFDARRYLELAQESCATHTVLVPVQYERLLSDANFADFDLSSFRMKFSTGALFAPALKQRVLEHWPGGLTEIYGMTEGGGACMLEAHKYRNKLHTVGIPMPRNDIRLIDGEDREVAAGEIGEIVGSSPAMMTCYLNQPAKSAEAEWHDACGKRFIRTGDIGRMDADGFLVLLDRKKDLIISGGFNVYPSDLEAVLREHPAVGEAAVVGVASPRWGETPVACVVLKQSAGIDGAALTAWANERLGKAQKIDSVKIMSSLPRSAVGKVLKKVLRDTLV
jgi:acyl-CoA synthetase (AMP-forming)/AMP-acid ligase II